MSLYKYTYHKLIFYYFSKKWETLSCNTLVLSRPRRELPVEEAVAILFWPIVLVSSHQKEGISPQLEMLNKIQTLKVCVLGLAQRQVKYMAAVKQPFQNHRRPECSEWKQLTFSVMSYSGRKALLFEWASPPGCRANDFIILLSGTFSSENVCVYREIHLHCLSAPLWGSII